MAQSGKFPTLDLGSGHDLMVHGMEHHVRLCTDSTKPAWDSLSPSLSAPLPLTHSLVLSKINKYISKSLKKIFQEEQNA